MSSAPNNKPTTPNLAGLAGQGVAVDAKGFILNEVLAESDPNNYGDTIEFLFRPGPVTQRSAARYDELRAIGMSHAYQSYGGTDNNSFSFVIYFNRLMHLKTLTMGESRGFREGADGGLQAISGLIEEQRRWIESLLLPPALPDGRVLESPPACILCLPGVVSMRCRLMSVDWTFKQVDVQGRLVELTGSVQFQEAPQTRLTMQDQLEVGMFR